MSSSCKEHNSLFEIGRLRDGRFYSHPRRKPPDEHPALSLKILFRKTNRWRYLFS